VSVAEELDHVVPLFKGGADDETNLQGLCKECHHRKTLADLAGFSAKVEGYDPSGWPIEKTPQKGACGATPGGDQPTFYSV